MFNFLGWGIWSGKNTKWYWYNSANQQYTFWRTEESGDDEWKVKNNTDGSVWINLKETQKWVKTNKKISEQGEECLDNCYQNAEKGGERLICDTILYKYNGTNYNWDYCDRYDIWKNDKTKEESDENHELWTLYNLFLRTEKMRKREAIWPYSN